MTLAQTRRRDAVQMKALCIPRRFSVSCAEDRDLHLQGIAHHQLRRFLGEHTKRDKVNLTPWFTQEPIGITANPPPTGGILTHAAGREFVGAYFCAAASRRPRILSCALFTSVD